MSAVALGGKTECRVLSVCGEICLYEKSPSVFRGGLFHGVSRSGVTEQTKGKQRSVIVTAVCVLCVAVGKGRERLGYRDKGAVMKRYGGVDSDRIPLSTQGKCRNAFFVTLYRRASAEQALYKALQHSCGHAPD